MTTYFVCSVTRKQIAVEMNYIIVEDLSTDCLFGLKDAVIHEITGIFDKQVLIFMDRDPIIGIGLIGCDSNPKEIILETAARKLSVGGTARQLTEAIQTICAPRKPLRQLNEEVYSTYQCCYEVTTQFERLDLKEPPPIRIVYSQKRIRKIQEKFPELWSEKTGKFKIPDIKLQLSTTMGTRSK